MNRPILNVLICFGALVAAVSANAEPADTVRPELTLLGDNPVHVAQGSVYTDAGATATDNVDGDLTTAIVVHGVVNTAKPGIYFVFFRVQDSSGNFREAKRTVIVDPSAPVNGVKADLKAQLVAVGDYGVGSGRARYENNPGGESHDKSDAPESKLVVEVRDVNASTTVDVHLNGASLGSATVYEGKARFALESERGDTVPAVQEGDLIEALDGASQAVLLSGKFAADSRESHTPRPHPLADVNQDGVFSFADIHEVALAALGQIQSIYDVDLDNNGIVDIADVQLELNAGCGFVEHYFSGEIGHRSRLEARLTPKTDANSAARGKAHYGSYFDHRSLCLKLEGLSGTTQIEVTADGASLGTFDVTGAKMTLKWDTRHGGSVPLLHDGSVIEVSDAATHAGLVSGAFHFGPQDNSHYYLDFYSADLNGDGRVDAADVLFVTAAALGQNVGTINADVNADGVVDQIDVEIVTLVAVISGCGHSCDIDSDGHVSALDIQQVINGALSLGSHPEDADVDGNENVDALDVQLVIGKALSS